ncbi:MAG TPA: DurN family substrate-assisted peptide maturase [Actinomycetota bacterium]|nr:DurN family substrate-assisted peptide maturase [Actinomycetota bacterium]
MVIERDELRCIQFLIVLLSCLPAGGRCREVLELALALDEGPALARLNAPRDLTTNVGVLAWLDSLWAREDLSPEERELVWWQNDGQRMAAAIRELAAVEARLGRAWIVAPEGFLP